MPENTSNFAHSHCSRRTDSRWRISHCASWEAPDSPSPGENKGRLEVRLGFETALGQAWRAPCGDGPARGWDGAQPSVLRGARAGWERCWCRVAGPGGPGRGGQRHGGRQPARWSDALRRGIWLREGFDSLFFSQCLITFKKKMCLPVTLTQALEVCMGKVRVRNAAIHHHIFSTDMLLTWSIFQIQVSVTTCRESNLGLSI